VSGVIICRPTALWGTLCNLIILRIRNSYIAYCWQNVDIFNATAGGRPACIYVLLCCKLLSGRICIVKGNIKMWSKKKFETFSMQNIQMHNDYKRQEIKSLVVVSKRVWNLIFGRQRYRVALLQRGRYYSAYVCSYLTWRQSKEYGTCWRTHKWILLAPGIVCFTSVHVLFVLFVPH
jgi:hypothetical protein